MLEFGEQFAKGLTFPAVIELVGDVGTGKTTFTRGLAKGLGVKSTVTSPSFTISKQYSGDNCTLIHYDFYRLKDPGIMQDDLLESMQNPHAVVVVEWADTVKNLLPEGHQKIEITLNDDESREVIL